MPRPHTVRVQEIAARAGFSVATVRHVLSGRAERYHPDTRRAVQAVAEAMGYRPNLAARSVRRGKFGAIGAMIRHDGSSLDYNLLKHMYRCALRRRLLLVYAEPDEILWGEQRLESQLFNELCVDGLIVHTGYNPTSDLLQRLSKSPVPLVFANADGSHDCVRPDEADGVGRAYASLRKRGCRRIAWAAMAGVTPSLPPGMEGHHSRSERMAAFAACVAADGGETLAPLLLTSDPLAQAEQAASWLAQVAPDGVITEGIGEAETLARAIHHVIKRPVQVVAFSVTPLRHLTRLGVGQIAIPLERIAESSFEMLEDRLADGGRSLPTRLIGYEDPTFPDAAR